MIVIWARTSSLEEARLTVGKSAGRAGYLNVGLSPRRPMASCKFLRRALSESAENRLQWWMRCSWLVLAVFARLAHARRLITFRRSGVSMTWLGGIGPGGGGEFCVEVPRQAPRATTRAAILPGSRTLENKRREELIRGFATNNCEEAASGRAAAVQFVLQVNDEIPEVIREKPVIKTNPCRLGPSRRRPCPSRARTQA